MLAAEQLLPGQAAWVALPSAHCKKSLLLGHYPPSELVRRPTLLLSVSFVYAVQGRDTAIGDVSSKGHMLQGTQCPNDASFKGRMNP